VRDEPASQALLIANATYGDATLRSLAGTAIDVQALKEVLSHPDIGGYEVDISIDEPGNQVHRRIERFFTQASRESRLLLYISGHGVKDRDGRLYFAAQDTDSNMLMSSGIAATFIQHVSERSRCRRQIFIFDTCFSGAFARGYVHKAGRKAHAQEPFSSGTGKIVMTASDDIQYALLEDAVEGSATASVFTRCLVEGLRTGEAANEDGYVTAELLYQHVHDRLREENFAQQPQLWCFGMRGDFVVARRPAAATGPLPADLLSLLDHPQAKVRLLGLDELENLLAVPLLRTAVHKALTKRVTDKHEAVSRRALGLLERIPADALPGPQSSTQTQADADARRQAEEAQLHAAELERARQAPAQSEIEAEATRRKAAEPASKAHAENTAPPRSATEHPSSRDWRQWLVWPAMAAPVMALMYVASSGKSGGSGDAPAAPPPPALSTPPEPDEPMARIGELLADYQKKYPKSGGSSDAPAAPPPPSQAPSEPDKPMARIGELLADYQKKYPDTEADIKAVSEQYKKKQAEGNEYRARHILVEKEDEAKALIAQLQAGAKFEELAKKNSKDPGSGSNGGDLDWANPTSYVAPFSEALVKLKKGETTTTPVKSDFGYHVIRLDDIRAAQPQSLWKR
jgi:parvulin-like peptidyl-prolyl isomerase